MGIDSTFGLAFSKSQLAAGDNLADGGTVFFSVADRDKPAGLEAAVRFVAAGFTIAATAGTADYLEKAGRAGGNASGQNTDARERGGGRWRARRGRCRGRRRADPVGEGAPRGQHAPWPGLSSRWGLHQASGPPIQGPAGHNGGGGQSRRSRGARAGGPALYRQVAPGTPRRALGGGPGAARERIPGPGPRH